MQIVPSLFSGQKKKVNLLLAEFARVVKVNIVLTALAVTYRYLNFSSGTCLVSLCALSAPLWHMPNSSSLVYILELSWIAINQLKVTVLQILVSLLFLWLCKKQN